MPVAIGKVFHVQLKTSVEAMHGIPCWDSYNIVCQIHNTENIHMFVNLVP